MPTRLGRMLETHRKMPFPTSIEKGTDYGSVDPVLIDADIYGWSLHVSEGRPLGVIERPRFETAREELARSLDALPGDARPYYELLLDLADEALAQDLGVH